MNNQDFEAKVALITGAASGIGFATAQLLAAGGAALLLLDRRADALDDAAQTLERAGARVETLVGDVSDPASHAASVDAAVSAFGALHLAFNNAGIAGAHGLPHEVSVDEYHKAIRINLDSVFYGLHFQAPAILAAGRGSIVNTASVAGIVGVGGMVTYSATKHAVVGLTRAAAVGYAAQGLRINAVAPGYIDTPLLAAAPRDVLASQHPSGRLGTGSEVAEVVAFLLSERASNVVGSIVAVDGGYTAQ